MEWNNFISKVRNRTVDWTIANENPMGKAINHFAVAMCYDSHKQNADFMVIHLPKDFNRFSTSPDQYRSAKEACVIYDQKLSRSDGMCGLLNEGEIARIWPKLGPELDRRGKICSEDERFFILEDAPLYLNTEQ